MISVSPIKSMQLEFEKSKRKPTLLMVLFIILINLCYLFIGIRKNDMADFPYAWEAILFYFPLLNTIFLSVFMAVLASRTMDLEHKAGSWNLLQTLQSPSSLYLGKILYGFVWLVIFCVLEMGITIAFAKYMHFPGFPPLKALLLTFVGEIIGGMVIYQLQLLLSMLFTMQFVALFISLCGTLAGIFMMYISDRLLFPWSVISALRALNMEYHSGDKYSSYSWYFPPQRDWLLAIFYLGLTLLLGFILYTHMEENHLRTRAGKTIRTHKIHTALPAEMIKLKHSPVWIAFILMPVISAIIGIINFLANQGILSFSWEALWTQQSLFLGFFFLSPLTGVLCSLLWRMEHHGTNWNIILTIESPGRLIRDKLCISSGMSILCILWIGILYIISGKAIGLTGTIPAEFFECMLCGSFACISLSAVQSYLSLTIRSFTIPIGIALAGGFLGMMFLSKGWGFFLPYAMVQMGLKSTSLTNELNVPAFIIACAIYVAIFYFLSVWHIRRTDVKTME